MKREREASAQKSRLAGIRNDCMSRGTVFMDTPQASLCGVIQTSVPITCPDGSTFRFRWTKDGLETTADTLADGTIAPFLIVHPQMTNVITLTAARYRA